MTYNIDKIRKDILFYKNFFLNSSLNKKIDVQLSSLISLRYLLFSNLRKVKNFKSEIKKNNILKQFSNSLFIANFSSIQVFGDLKDIKHKRYSNIVLSWSSKKNFRNNGFYKDPYFNISSLNKKYLWILIHEDKVPEKLDKNIILFRPKRGNILSGVSNLIKYIFSIIFKKNFSIHNVFHQISYDSYLANFINNFFINRNLFKKVKFLHIPLESQPFQNALIDFAKKKKITSIGYDHTCNPFPFYNSYSKISPDKLMVHSNCSRQFYTKIFNWPKNKVKKISSVRFYKKNKSFYSNKIFLPIMINNFDDTLLRLEIFFRDHSRFFNPARLKICLHPATKKIKKFKNFKNKIIKLQKKYKKNVKVSRAKLFSVHLGNTSTIIESLEHGLDAIHVISSEFFDFLSPNLWYSVKYDQLDEHIFRYKLKSLGHCVTFNNKKKRVSL